MLDGGLYYLHYTIHFLDMQLSLSITQSISKLPKSSARTKTLWTDILRGADINLGIERRDKGYDGLVGDGSHIANVSDCYCFSHCYYPFVAWFAYVWLFWEEVKRGHSSPEHILFLVV